MSVRQHFCIVGSGSDLPGDPLSAADVERRAELPEGWIAKHTQVAFRHECVPPESLLSMAARAVSRALADAQLTLSEIDLIIDGSTSRHQPIPCNAAVLQAALGEAARGIPCVDVHGTCLGFILGLNIANALLGTGQYRRILIVCAEAPLTAANWHEAESATLLGDGAAAVVLERCEASAPWSFRHQTFSDCISDCEVRGGGHHLPAFRYTPENDADFRFHMDGPKLLQTALKRLPDLVRWLLDDARIERGEVLVIPHQASPRALSMIRRRLRLRENQFVDRAALTGNLAAASIPLLVDQLRRDGRLERGRPTLLLGTSAGYAQAGMIFVP